MLIPLITASVTLAQPVVDTEAYDAASGVVVERSDSGLRVRWPMEKGEWGQLSLDIRPGQELIEYLAVSQGRDGPPARILERVRPLTLVTIGKRDLEKRKGWTIFFDKVHQRPHETFPATLDLTAVRVTSRGRRSTVSLDRVSAGPFDGTLEFTFYAGSRLVHARVAASSEWRDQAIVYDAGLAGPEASWKRIAWMRTDGRVESVTAGAATPARAEAVRHRTIVSEGEAGSVAVFPPPHQYFYPLDFSDNLKFVWHGKGYRERVRDFGLGVRQPLDGDRRFVPWFNAPPGTRQNMGVFYLLSRGAAAGAIEEVKRYTRGDRFARIPGHRTFTSHFHVEHTTELMGRQGENFSGSVDEVRIPPDLRVPGFVEVFKALGVDIAHLAEFHFGRTPGLDAQKRLPLLELMHRECERLSDDDFLLIPGEEPNVHLGGHWISLFPRPVYWILNREAGTPFAEPHPRHGTVYHVGSAEDVLTLLQREKGLAWTAHPRIKSSTGFPDGYRETEFYRSDRFLGAAWKAMPADLSLPRLGRRVLDLLDDMANWGQEKYVLGEVDTFKTNPGHEQYAHMNINYLRLDEIPDFTDGWPSVLDALRGGKFFVTTGEVLLRRVALGGKQSGETLELPEDGDVQLELDVEWTFPLAFAELITGDGREVGRERVELDDTEPFGRRTLRLRPKLAGQKWIRLEVWDVAANGAFSQPVWLK